MHTHSGNDEEAHSRDVEIDYQDLYKKEFPENYANIKVTADTNWVEEYNACYEDNYRISLHEQKNLIRAFKLLDLDHCSQEITIFLDIIAAKTHQLSLAITLSPSDKDTFRDKHVGLYQWLTKHRPDISKKLNEEIYTRIIVPACNNDPNKQVEWAIRWERNDAEITRYLAAASDPIAINTAIHLALELNRNNLAELALEKFDPLSILKQTKYYPQQNSLTFILGKLTPESIQQHLTDMCKEGNYSKVSTLLKNGLKIRLADWEVVCGANPATQDHYKMVDLFLKKGETIPEILLNSSAVTSEGMNIYLRAKMNALEANDWQWHFINACVKGDEKLALLLIDKGANPAAVDASGVPAFTHACLSRNTDLILKLAWKYKVDPIPTLHQACIDGNSQIIKTLKERRIISGNQDTPSEVEAVKLACAHGHTEAVKILLNAGLGGGGVHANTVMEKLSDPFNHASVDTLLRAINGAPERAIALDPVFEKGDLTINSQLLEVLWSLPDDTSGQGTDHHYLYFAKACGYGTSADIKRMQIDDLTQTLNRALNYEPSAEIINYLLDQGADPAACERILLAACQTGDTSLINRLLQNGISPDEKDRNGEIPLVWACQQRNAEVIKALLNNGADVSPDKSNQSTPMETLFRLNVIEGHAVDDFDELKKLFIKNGADPGKIIERSKTWDSALQAATPRLFIETMVSLIKDENMRDAVTENYKSCRKAIQKDELPPDAEPAQTFYAIRELVNTINRGVSFEEFTSQRKEASLPLLAERIFAVDEKLYQASREMTARINLVEQLQQVLMAADLKKGSPLASLRDEINKHEDIAQFIAHLRQAKVPASPLQSLHMHARTDEHDNSVKALLKALKSEHFDAGSALQKVEEIKVKLVVTQPNQNFK